MTATVQVVGVADAIRSLNKLEPGLRKQFLQEANKIAEPAITEMRNALPPVALSGMERRWEAKGQVKFPYDQRRARNRIRVKFDARRRSKSPISIVESDPAASIIDMAGRRKGNPMADNLSRKFGHPASRFLWPAALRKVPQVQGEMEKAALTVVNRIDRELR